MRNHKPTLLWVLKSMLLILGVAALVPGMEMIFDPSGKSVGFPEGSLGGSPFSNYFIPGILLTVCIGLLSILAWYALWKKPDWAFCKSLNPFPARHWAWTAALMSGIALVIWISVQVLMVPYFFLQPTLWVWGLVIILLCLAPSVRAFYKIP